MFELDEPERKRLILNIYRDLKTELPPHNEPDNGRLSEIDQARAGYKKQLLREFEKYLQIKV